MYFTISKTNSHPAYLAHAGIRYPTSLRDLAWGDKALCCGATDHPKGEGDMRSSIDLDNERRQAWWEQGLYFRADCWIRFLWVDWNYKGCICFVRVWTWKCKCRAQVLCLCLLEGGIILNIKDQPKKFLVGPIDPTRLKE